MIRSLSLVLVIVTLCLSLSSCMIITGSYTAKVGSYQRTYTFTPFGIVTLVSVSESQTIKTTYRYKIENTDDGKMEISLTRRVDDSILTNTYDFEQGDGYIVIDTTRYDKT